MNKSTAANPVPSQQVPIARYIPGSLNKDLNIQSVQKAVDSQIKKPSTDDVTQVK